MKSGSTWYSTGSFWPELPNGREISGWLHQFPGKLDVHPGVDVTQLTISKFLRNPPSSCAAWHPPAFEQLEYCWPWNIVEPLSTPFTENKLLENTIITQFNLGERSTFFEKRRKKMCVHTRLYTHRVDLLCVCTHTAGCVHRCRSKFRSTIVYTAVPLR